MYMHVYTAYTYSILMQVLLDEKTDLRKELRTSKKQRDLEKVAKLYLARNNINVSGN